MPMGFSRHAAIALALSAAIAIPGLTTAQDATPAPVDMGALGPVVTNPFFPLGSVHSRVLEGDFTDPETGETTRERVEETVVLDAGAIVAGVEVAVVEVFEYADGELTEFTRDYYAQASDGTVYYLGEDVDMYEDGEVVSHEGAWVTGEAGAEPGLFMPASPQVGMTFEQERAPGVAEDTSTVVATGLEVTVPAGTFGGCIETEDTNPLDGSTEHKAYCPGVGIVREQNDEGALELVSFAGGSIPASEATPVG